MTRPDPGPTVHDRGYLLRAGLAAVALGPTASAADSPDPKTPSVLDRICLFTDHLDDHGFTYAEVAAHLKLLGVAGPDLTVRPGGLVPPDRVAEEVPKAAAAFRDAGLTIPMASTGLTSAADPAARPGHASRRSTPLAGPG